MIYPTVSTKQENKTVGVGSATQKMPLNNSGEVPYKLKLAKRFSFHIIVEVVFSQVMSTTLFFKHVSRVIGV